MVRKQIRARLWEVYVAWCKDRTPPVGTVSKDFFNTRGWGPGGHDAKDRGVKECTCGKCFYLGKQGFEILTELLVRVKAMYGDMSLESILLVPVSEAAVAPPATVHAYVEGLLARAKMLFEMLTMEFPKHCAISSKVSEHCARCALSAPLDPHFDCRCAPDAPFKTRAQKAGRELNDDEWQDACAAPECLFKLGRSTGSLLLCDFCENVYHLKCLPGNSSYKKLPRGRQDDVDFKFICPECRVTQHAAKHDEVCLPCSDFTWLFDDMHRLLSFLEENGASEVKLWMRKQLGDAAFLLGRFQSHLIRHYVQNRGKTNYQNTVGT